MLLRLNNVNECLQNEEIKNLSGEEQDVSVVVVEWHHDTAGRIDVFHLQQLHRRTSLRHTAGCIAAV